MEGTDAVITRAGEITGGRSFVVVKVAKPGQDMRFDVPVIGVKTIEAMAAAGASALSVTSKKTLLFEKENLLETAAARAISIVGAKAGA